MKILICVHDLLEDEPGLIFGEQLARAFQAEVMLLHVLPKNKVPGDRNQGERLLRSAREIFGGYPVTMRVRRGTLGKRIAKEAERGEFDFVLVPVSRIGEGRQPTMALHKSLLGKLPCCLMVAKNPRANLDRILICTGGLQISDSLVEIGAEIAGAVGAEVTLFHVAANIPTMYTGLETIEETLSELLQTETPVAKHLRRGAEILSEKNIQAEIKLRHGAAVYEIVREIDLEDYDMIVVGVSGADNLFKTWFYGNVTHEIIDSVGIPILVVEQKRGGKTI